MAQDILPIILDELRSLRSAVDELAADTKQRLATLEAHDHDLIGNGQPGRMKTAENRLASLEHRWYYVLGIAATVSAIITAAFRLCG
jgi:hypothetical protein